MHTAERHGVNLGRLLGLLRGLSGGLLRLEQSIDVRRSRNTGRLLRRLLLNGGGGDRLRRRD